MLSLQKSGDQIRSNWFLHVRGTVYLLHTSDKYFRFSWERVSLPLVLLNYTGIAVYGFLSWQLALQTAVGFLTH